MEVSKSKEELIYELNERIKEMECHYQLSEIMSNPTLTVEEFCQQTVDILPSGWQHPERTAARLYIDGATYHTANFRESKHLMIENIELLGQVRGEISISVDIETGLSDKPVFLQEEYRLLRSIAIRIGKFIEKSQNDQSLSESNQLYKAIINASPDGISIVDPNGKIMFASPKTLEMFGLTSQEELHGRNFIEFIVEADRDRAKSTIIKMYQGIYSGAAVYRAYKTDKSVFDVEVNAEFIRDDNGNPVRILFIIRDVTNRTLVEQALRKSESDFKLLIESAPVGIVILDSDQQILSINKKFNQITGYSKQIIQNIDVWWKLAYPDEEYRNRIKQEWEEELRVYFSGRRSFIPTEVRICCSDGSYKYVEISLVSTGNLNIVTFVDTTERTLNSIEITNQKNYISSILSAMPDLLFVVDRTGIILDVNEGKDDKLYVPSEVFLSKNVLEVLPNDIASEFIQSIQSVLAGKPVAPFHYKLPSKGGIADYEARFTPFGSDKVIAIVSNITNRIEIELALRESEEKYKILFFESPDAYLIIRDGKFAECNKAAEHLIGASREDILGKSPADLSPEFQPNGRRSDEYATELFNGTFEKGEKTFDWWHLRMDGKKVLFRINLVVITYEGRKVMFTTWHDITEKQKAEEKLRELSQAVEQSPVSIVITNLDGTIKYVNPKTCETTGYTEEELIGHNPRVLKSGETTPDEYDYLWQNISTGKAWQGIFHNKKKNGELYWESSTISPIIDSEGKITHYLAVKKDITSEKQAEEELLKFRTISDQSYSGNAIADMDGILRYSNEAFAHMHGYEIDEIIGQPLIMLHSEQQLLRVNEALDLLKSKGGFAALEVWRTRKDGTAFPSLMNARVIFDDHNQPQYLSASAVDITEQFNQEREIRKLSLAIEQSPVSVVITNTEGSIEYVNPAFETATGYSSEEVIGKNPRILKSGKTPPETYIELWATISAGKEWHCEWINRKKNGDLYWEDIFITPIFDTEGKITNYLSIKQDITSRKKTENEIRELNSNLEQKVEQRTRQLQKANEALLNEIDIRRQAEKDLIKAKSEAENANLAKSEFLSRMSHELRTPMNSILGFTQLLVMTEQNESSKKKLNHILKSGKHLLDLINEVLDIARIESGRISLSLEPVQAGNVIMEAVDIVKPLAAKQQIILDVQNSSAFQLFVKADRQRLKQVLINLLNNAVKYNKENGRIEVTTEQIAEVLRISVKDTGLGISPENINRIFNPFERIGAEKTETEGTGLGLAVSKKLMDAMGGTIGIDSVVNEGTTFWIEFPTTLSQHENAGSIQASHSTDQEFCETAGLILYIEDNASNIELVEQLLNSRLPGVRLMTQMNGRPAIKLAAEFKPDLILLDLNLPDIHGSEVLKMLMESPVTKSIPVVVISADAMSHQQEKLLKYGARDYLTKPLDVPEFLRVVEFWVKKNNK